ncbi:MAG: MarR family transcriptional regulator [Deltaproteobacteria bacterium]|nr:MarR family transcriptional regulator [Deltaproteobacteria bacterium]
MVAARSLAPKAARLLSLDEQICFPIYAASNLLQRVYRPLLEPLGLTYAQYLVMLVLWENDDVPVKALSERLLLDSGTLSPLLKRLEAQRLVRKRADASDRRMMRIGLTPKGRALRAEAVRVPETLACRMLGEGGPEAAARFFELRAQMKSLVSELERALGPQGE